MNKYSTIIETTMQRFTSGGFLTGDMVKLKKNIMSSEWAKRQPSNLLEKLKEFAETDKHIRVSAVKALRPAVSGSVQPHNQVDDYYCDIVIESVPGLYHDFMTLPAELLEYQERDINLPELPDSLRHDDNLQHEPKELSAEDVEDENSPVVNEDPVHSMTDSNYTDVPAPNTTDNFGTKAYISGLG